METPSEENTHFADAVFLEHYVGLRQMLLLKTQDPTLTDDLLQDLYLKIRQIKNFSEIKDIKSYVFRMGRNLLTDFYRSQIRSEQWVQSQSLLTEQSTNMNETLEKQQKLNVFQQALEELPETCQQVFRLNRVEGLTHTEIAEKMDISVSWVEKNIMKAMKHCQAKWKKVSH